MPNIQNQTVHNDDLVNQDDSQQKSLALCRLSRALLSGIGEPGVEIPDYDRRPGGLSVYLSSCRRLVRELLP